MFLNRRRHTRQTLSPDVYVDLGPDNSGWLSNISEGGLELHLFRRGAVGQGVRLGFGLPGAGDRIEVNCRIAWIDKFGRKAGMEFLNLSEASQQRIREWHPSSVTKDKDKDAKPKSASHRGRMFVLLILLAISLIVLYPFMQKRLPASLGSVPPPETTASREVQVWAVKQTGTYYCPDSKLYGKAGSGVLMTQEKAVEGGYRPVGGEACR